MNGFTDKCHRHPEHPTWKCRQCDAESAPPPDGWKDGIAATLTRRARPARRPDPTPADLADVHARADREATT